MLSIEKTSGLPIEVTEDFRLKFNPPLPEFPMTFARKFSEMTPVLLDSTAKPPAVETYFVYRRIHLPEHALITQESKLIYDITIVPPLKLGQELNKTVGHYHAVKPGTNVAHPEIYEVLHGEALILLQKMDEKFENVLDVLVVKAKTGEKIIYPPGYGHILVNIGSDLLVMADWQSLDTKSLYEPVTAKRGMAYYVVADSGNGYELVANTNYKDIPKVRMVSDAAYKSFPIASDQPMYVAGMKNPKLLEFLNFPEKYLAEFAQVTS